MVQARKAGVKGRTNSVRGPATMTGGSETVTPVQKEVGVQCNR